MAGNAKEFMKALEYFKREMRLELRSVKDSVKFCSDTCDETKAIGADVKALLQEIGELIKINETLQNENRRLTRRVEDLEQYTRLNNLEIKGIKSDEDPADIVKKSVTFFKNQLLVMTSTRVIGSQHASQARPIGALFGEISGMHFLLRPGSKS
ncbi:hypothetical protein HPB49_005149 [Dermacentor silvarum]|uniref:Uncharacterized protein n=1 Tax=Dermacentor silvarum TaxID=543639 RepID=A0ACB8CDB3_DERSI|nr:hypothetical protein HPB49_005149 [Dermacentor silvarum]